MATVVQFRKGEVIYPEGSFEMAMYLIKEGTVSVYANYGKDDQMLLKDETKGKYFGHLELIEAIPRSATTVAKEDTILEKISGNEFGAYFHDKPDQQMEILTQTSARLREIGESLHAVYSTIDEYLREERKDDPSFLHRLSRIITFGRSHKEQP